MPPVYSNDKIYNYAVVIFCIQMFKQMRIPQIRDPSLPPVDQLPESYHTKVTFIG